MADTRFKVENGLVVAGTGSNSVFEHRVTMNANLTVAADLLYVGGNLYVQGNSVIVGTTEYDTDIVPLVSNTRLVGNSTNRFYGNFVDTTIQGNLSPTSNGLSLGITTKRWAVYAQNIDATGTLTLSNNATVTGNLDVTGRVVVTNSISQGNTTVTGFVNASSTGTFGGNLSVTGTATITGNATAQNIILNSAAIFANSKTASGITQTIIDGFPASLGKFCQAFVTVSTGTLLHAVNINVVQDGTSVLYTRSNELYNSLLGTFTSDINGANVELYFTGVNSAATYTVKTIRQQIL